MSWKQYNKFGTFPNGKPKIKQSIELLATMDILDVIFDLNETLTKDNDFSKLSEAQLALFRWLNED